MPHAATDEAFARLDVQVEAGSLDLVVSARPAAAEATYEELREEFSKALGKVGGSVERRSV